MKIQAKQKLLMIGDSITDCERVRPIGEGRMEGYGKGYVSLVNAFIQTSYPERRIRVVNMGISANTVRDLKARWQTDVLDLKPDWVSIMIGINDVWRTFHSPQMPERHVPLPEYEKTLTDLLNKTLPKVKGAVLMTPFFIENNHGDPMRTMMDLYGASVKKIAKKFDLPCVDTQAAFDHVLKSMHSSALAWDRIHPETVGHMVIARAFLKTIDFEK
ncbi:MAG: SGNH/GDSL hydrolase family protein [Verrucomicrobiota bacterium]